MAITRSVTRHGTFIYNAAETIKDYGSVSALVGAAQRAGMTHVWIRLHGTSTAEPPKATQALIDGFKATKINVAGWGWCQGSDIQGEIKLAVSQLKKFGLDDYVADIEEGVNNSHWTPKMVTTFLSGIRPAINGSLIVSTHPLIDWHSPELMKAASPIVDGFAPQVYWFNYPNQQMVKEFRKPNGGKYIAKDPASYSELCLDRWTLLTDKPLILTGQAYWGESNYTQEEAQASLDTFLSTFNLYPRIIGLNWWHFGGKEAMSHHMYEAIVAGKLDKRPYKKA